MEPVILMVAKFGVAVAGVLAVPLAMYAMYSALRGGTGNDDPQTPGDDIRDRVSEGLYDPLSADPYCFTHIPFDGD